jgi:hypothetical protein
VCSQVSLRFPERGGLGQNFNQGLYAQTLENSVRQFAATFLGLIGSNPQFEGAFVAFFQCQVCQHRIEIDRNSSATKGIVALKIDMLPSSWKDLLQKGLCFGISFPSKGTAITNSFPVAYAAKNSKNLVAAFSPALARIDGTMCAWRTVKAFVFGIEKRVLFQVPSRVS